MKPHAQLFAIILSLSACQPAEMNSHPGSDAIADPMAADAAGGTDQRGREADLSRAAPDLARRADARMDGCPAPSPPPMMCDQRHAGVTGIQVLLRVDEYRGLQRGRNGTHEIVEATVLCTAWVYDMAVVDTDNVEVAMNVKSPKDPSGLPMEVPLSAGDTFEVEGEYIPAATANAKNAHGPAAVIHYAHSPCGYAVLAGKKYQ